MISLGLGGSYWLVQTLVPGGPALGALVVHLLIAAYILWRWQLPWLPEPARRRWFRWGLAVSALLVSLSLLAAGLTATVTPSLAAGHGLGRQLLMLLLVPPVEEIVFRWGCGRLFKARQGEFWGGYWSVVFFAWAHVLAITPIWDISTFYVPWAPLVLGITCEYLFQQTRSLVLPIVMHIAANITGFVFYWFDSSLLDWLSPLYLHG